MSRPELSGERRLLLRDDAAATLSRMAGDHPIVYRAETTLALLDYVGELEGHVAGLLRLVGGCITEPACGRCTWCDARSTLPQPPAADKEQR